MKENPGDLHMKIGKYSISHRHLPASTPFIIPKDVTKIEIYGKKENETSEKT